MSARNGGLVVAGWPGCAPRAVGGSSRMAGPHHGLASPTWSLPILGPESPSSPRRRVYSSATTTSLYAGLHPQRCWRPASARNTRDSRDSRESNATVMTAPELTTNVKRWDGASLSCLSWDGLREVSSPLPLSLPLLLLLLNPPPRLSLSLSLSTDQGAGHRIPSCGLATAIASSFSSPKDSHAGVRRSSWP